MRRAVPWAGQITIAPTWHGGSRSCPRAATSPARLRNSPWAAVPSEGYGRAVCDAREEAVENAQFPGPQLTGDVHFAGLLQLVTCVHYLRACRVPEPVLDPETGEAIEPEAPNDVSEGRAKHSAKTPCFHKALPRSTLSMGMVSRNIAHPITSPLVVPWHSQASCNSCLLPPT